jgi:acyl dehydratase
MNDVSLGLNYGFNRVRFVSPVPVGSRVRMRARLVSVDDDGRSLEQPKGNVLATIEQIFEIDGQEKPACVAEALVMYYA